MTVQFMFENKYIKGLRIVEESHSADCLGAKSHV